MLHAIEPTKKYFFTMFVVSCLLLMIFTAVIYRESEANEEHTKWVIRAYEVLRLARVVMTQELNVESGQRGFLLSNSPRFLEPYHNAITMLDKDMENLIAASINEEEIQRRNIENLRHKVELHKGIIDRHLKQFIHTGVTPTVGELEESKWAMDEVRDTLNEIIKVGQEHLTQRLIAVRKQHRNYLFTLFTGAGLALGALIIANTIIYTLLVQSKRVGDELRASEERFALVMNGINDGIFDYNVAERTIYYSSSYKRMLGYDEGDHPDSVEMFNSLLHPDDAERTWDIFNQYANRERGEYVNFFRMRHKNGSWRWIMSRGVGMWNEQGEMYRLIGAHTDITVQKEREEELEQLNADLEGFAYIASHDLRAPLVNMKGFAGEIGHAVEQINSIYHHNKELLQPAEKTALEEVLEKDIPESLGFINSAVERMDKLTSAILDMSRIGRREYHLERLNSYAIVQRCLDSLAHEIYSRNITVKCNELPEVVADALALEQIFANILDNAIKFLKPEEKGVIEIAARDSGTEVVFSIRDNGRGIAEQDKRRIFEIFRRASNSGDVRGTGMGMAYVKAMLRKLGGKIWFKSALGEGTVFYFSLPVKQEKRMAA